MANLSNSMYFRFLLASIFLISVSAQCQPFWLETTQVSSTQLSLLWSCDDPGDDDELQVTYQLINRGQCDTGDGSEDPPFDHQTTQWGTWHRQSTTSTNVYHSATLNNLFPYSTYRVNVRGRQPNGAGGYNPGNPVYLDPNPTTSEAAPSGSPTIELTAHAEYQTSLSFVWGEIPCEQRNGNIIYSYETRNRNNQLVSGVTYLPFRTVLGVYNLPCGNTYKVHVVANQTTYSEYGTGTTCCSTRGAGAVVNLMPTDLTSTQRRYTWTAPTYSGCPSPSGTLQYDVSFVGVSRLTGCSLQNHQGAYTISNLYYDIYSLKPFYSYTFTVTAVGGTDSSDTWFTSQPAQRVYPSNIMLSASTTTSLTISWDEIPCNSRNGNIQEYPYELSSSNGVRIRADEVVMTSATITGLERDTTYAFRVAARTEAGIGTMSNKVNFQTMAISISAPTDITAVMILKTSLTFAWSAVTCTGGTCSGPITGYAWRLLLNNGIIVDSGNIGANLLSVTVSGLRPCTVYIFEVAGITASETGSYGTREQETAGGVPGIPLGLSVVNALKDMTRIQWIPPASLCPVDSYTVEYRLIDRDQCQQITNETRISHGTAAAVSSPFSTISDLLPYSTYEFFVHAVNSDGQGLEASVTAMTLEDDRPSAAPANVIVTSTDRSSLSFSWDEVPCGNRHGVIQRYQYVLQTETLSTVEGPTYISDRMVTIMSSLSPCTTYRFRVRATFSLNNGNSFDWSEYIYAVTAGAVDTLSIVPQSSTELAVSWTVPSDSCTTIAVYTVEYRLINQDQCLELDNSEVQYGIVSETSAALTNLRPYSTYEVSVKVESSVETQSATTKGSTPTSGPDNLTAVTATNSSITFTWSEPPCGQRNGIITGYTYSFIEGGSRAKRAVNVEDETTTEMTVTFTDLDIYTEYTFTIAAYTDAGKGVATTMTYRTLAGVPSAPTQPKETTTTDSKPVIQWSTPDMPNGEIIEYIIRYWSSDDLLLTAAVEGKTLMYTFPDILKTNTTYNFQVRAKTSVGVGPWSDVITVFIAPIAPSGPVNQHDQLGPIIGGVVAVILIVGVVLIALICYYRRNKVSTQETPKETAKDENEIYDEIDAKKEMMAKQQQQRLQTLETGYEVNMAMETKMSPRAPSDGSAYEDVNIKKESEYQGLDLDAVNEEQSYQDLRGNTVGDKSAPQYANV